MPTCLVIETIARCTRTVPPRWYTRHDSHNREVTRVKKDVRVNLAHCISGDELIPPISLWLSISISVSSSHSFSPSSLPPLSLSLSFSLSIYLSIYLSFLFLSPSSFLSRNVPSACPPDRSLSYCHSSFWTMAMHSFLATTHHVEFLFIYGGVNEP